MMDQPNGYFAVIFCSVLAISTGSEARSRETVHQYFRSLELTGHGGHGSAGRASYNDPTHFSNEGELEADSTFLGCLFVESKRCLAESAVRISLI